MDSKSLANLVKASICLLLINCGLLTLNLWFHYDAWFKSNTQKQRTNQSDLTSQMNDLQSAVERVQRQVDDLDKMGNDLDKIKVEVEHLSNQESVENLAVELDGVRRQIEELELVVGNIADKLRI